MNESNSSKYKFEDFTIAHYIQILKAVKENYAIVKYDNFNKEKKFAIIRHDIDFSPQRALRMAQVESEERVYSTYFVNIHCEYYNFFEKDIREIILTIHRLGHDIGIHFDTHFYDINSEQLIIEKLKKEKAILEDYLSVDIRSFSFHNTNPFVLSCQEHSYGGLTNTYSSYFQKEVTYCSDSNGYWRFQRMHDVITKGDAPRLQLLTHPEWWQEEIMSPWQRIKRAINGRAQRNLEGYTEILKNYGNKNIDW